MLYQNSKVNKKLEDILVIPADLKVPLGHQKRQPGCGVHKNKKKYDRKKRKLWAKLFDPTW